MSDFDPFDPSSIAEIPTLPSLDKIDRQDNANDLAKRSVVRIDANLCEEAGVCAQVCPEDVLEFLDGHIKIIRPEACTECWICVENCASGAIDIG